MLQQVLKLGTRRTKARQEDEDSFCASAWITTKDLCLTYDSFGIQTPYDPNIRQLLSHVTTFEKIIKGRNFSNRRMKKNTRRFTTCTLRQMLLEWSNEDKMDGACSTHGRDAKCIQYLGRKTWREENLEDLGIDGNVILDWILRK